MSQSDIRPFATHQSGNQPGKRSRNQAGNRTGNRRASMRPADFESRMRFGLNEVLTEHPELREVLPLAAMMDDAVRWCA